MRLLFHSYGSISTEID
uniref:Uncharacterized protein n=1 Tax=Rhizophora mucronata TaxID=61149 RepID=A0A2P2QDN2_RHIMU